LRFFIPLIAGLRTVGLAGALIKGLGTVCDLAIARVTRRSLLCSPPHDCCVTSLEGIADVAFTGAFDLLVLAKRSPMVELFPLGRMFPIFLLVRTGGPPG